MSPLRFGKTAMRHRPRWHGKVRVREHENRRGGMPGAFAKECGSSPAQDPAVSLPASAIANHHKRPRVLHSPRCDHRPAALDGTSIRCDPARSVGTVTAKVEPRPGVERTDTGWS